MHRRMHQHANLSRLKSLPRSRRERKIAGVCLSAPSARRHQLPRTSRERPARLAPLSAFSRTQGPAIEMTTNTQDTVVRIRISSSPGNANHTRVSAHGRAVRLSLNQFFFATALVNDKTTDLAEGSSGRFRRVRAGHRTCAAWVSLKSLGFVTTRAV